MKAPWGIIITEMFYIVTGFIINEVERALIPASSEPNMRRMEKQPYQEKRIRALRYARNSVKIGRRRVETTNATESGDALIKVNCYRACEGPEAMIAR